MFFLIVLNQRRLIYLPKIFFISFVIFIIICSKLLQLACRSFILFSITYPSKTVQMFLRKWPKFFSTFNSFNALSPLDGRYAQSLGGSVSSYFSEAALMKYRIKVEAEWLVHLIETNVIPKSTQISLQQFKHQIRNLYLNFNDKSAARIKEIQATTNHDLKSVEYFMKENIHQNYKECVHFCCTSEDINNLAYALMLKEFSKEILVPKISNIVENLLEKSEKWADHKLLSRTHGQAATPSTLGKQYANFAYRLGKQVKQITRAQSSLTGKINGAVGNYNSHYFSYPNVNWRTSCEEFVEKKLNLNFNPYTTQIESHDSLVKYMGEVGLYNTITIGLCKDTWEYISKGYLTQKTKQGEIGSSTMPHKVNPIDFENCEGNLGVANSLADHFRNKLPISRLQRDLSDSTVLRNQGSILGYSMIGYSSLTKGLSKIESNQKFMEQQLQNHYEVITEAIQTQLRKINYPQPYELLKNLSRGKTFNKESLQGLLKELEKKLPSQNESITKIRSLTPLNYIGEAVVLARQCRRKITEL